MANQSFNSADTIRQALHFHQAGQFQEAEQLYIQVLKADPENASANHLLGVLAYQLDRHEIAVQLISKAILKDSGQAQYFNNLGLALQAQGKPEEALLAYTEAINVKPDYTDAHNNRGVILRALGRLEEALAVYDQILVIDPNDIGAHNNRGVVLQSLGRFEEALKAYEQAIDINPRYPDAHTNRGIILQALGRHDEALAAHAQAIIIKPDYAGAYNNRGHVLQSIGRFEEALASYRHAIAIKPDYADAHTNLGNLFLTHGKLEEAQEAYWQAIKFKPDNAGAYNNLGNVLISMGRLDEAKAQFQQALAIKPNYADAHNNLGNVLETLGRFDEALAAYEQALAVNPRHADAHNNRGIVFQKLGKHEQALAAYEQAIAVEPNFADAHNNRGNALQAQGKLEEAMSAYQQVINLRPDDARVYSNLLFCMNYDPGIDAQMLFKAHQEWEVRYASRFTKRISRHKNSPDPERQLRVGYVSPDFYSHPVATFIEPLLAAHDRVSFEVICYSNVIMPDAVTERLQKLADKWHLINGMSDDQVAELIREDGIDILVDLAGHTGGNRLLVFARKPAPVQLTYLGYPSTSGLSTIDYRLSDAWVDPPGLTDAVHSEDIIRLPGGFLCFKPLDPSPAVTPLPDLSPGNVTFASFNNAAKVTPEVVALWSRILHAVPDARLLMKAKQLGDPVTIARYRDLFEQHGIFPERLEFLYWVPSSEEHLAFYNRVHIGLDTFPYNGTTTTCEALWMGIPVITLAGKDSRSRVGLSILKHTGLDDFIAETPDAYIDIAVDLANDISKLQTVRSAMREKLQQSSLLDAKAFTLAVESAYRDIWKRWCS